MRFVAVLLVGALGLVWATPQAGLEAAAALGDLFGWVLSTPAGRAAVTEAVCSNPVTTLIFLLVLCVGLHYFGLLRFAYCKGVLLGMRARLMLEKEHASPAGSVSSSSTDSRTPLSRYTGEARTSSRVLSFDEEDLSHSTSDTGPHGVNLDATGRSPQ